MTSICTPRVTSQTPVRTSLNWYDATVLNSGQGQCTIYLGTLEIELTAVQAQQPDTLISITMNGVEHLGPSELYAGQALPSGVTLDEISLLPMVEPIQRVLNHFSFPYEIID
jgi:hypothetical protein